MGAGPSFGDFGAFGVIFVLFAIAAIGTAICKVWWTGELARRRGHDANEARITGFLTGDIGTAAAYLRSDKPATRADAAAAAASDEAVRLSVEERLADLAALVGKGLITADEATAKRAEILRDL